MGPLSDTNILLRWYDINSPDRPLILKALEILRRRGSDLFIVPQCLVEFWSVATRPTNVGGYELEPEEADRAIRLIESAFVILPETPMIYAEWRKIVIQHSIRGRQTHDARIVAAMRVNGLTEILTLNGKDFARYPDIVAIHPSEIK